MTFYDCRKCRLEKGTATYDGVTYTTPLKMESSTSIKFTAPEAGKLTLVFGTEVDSAAGKNVKINGKRQKSVMMAY